MRRGRFLILLIVFSPHEAHESAPASPPQADCSPQERGDPAHPEACRSTVERIAEHAAHYKQVGGIGVIALGSDFDGIDGHHQLETAADMPLLADALRRAGFTEDEVERIFWRNARDFFEHNL